MTTNYFYTQVIKSSATWIAVSLTAALSLMGCGKTSNNANNPNAFGINNSMFPNNFPNGQNNSACGQLITYPSSAGQSPFAAVCRSQTGALTLRNPTATANIQICAIPVLFNSNNSSSYSPLSQPICNLSYNGNEVVVSNGTQANGVIIVNSSAAQQFYSEMSQQGWSNVPYALGRAF